MKKRWKIIISWEKQRIQRAKNFRENIIPEAECCLFVLKRLKSEEINHGNEDGRKKGDVFIVRADELNNNWFNAMASNVLLVCLTFSSSNELTLLLLTQISNGEIPTADEGATWVYGSIRRSGSFTIRSAKVTGGSRVFPSQLTRIPTRGWGQENGILNFTALIHVLLSDWLGAN